MGLAVNTSRTANTPEPHSQHGHAPHLMPTVVGEVDHVRNGFNPTEILTDFDRGKVSKLPSGQPLREYTIAAENKVIEIIPGLQYAAWTYNGRIPGPTIRVRQGDRVRIKFLNAGDHKHSIHFHGIHPGNMDGVFDAASAVVQPGEKYTYEFDAEPFGFTSTTATQLRWPSTFQKDFTVRSSSIPRRPGRELTARL